MLSRLCKWVLIRFRVILSAPFQIRISKTRLCNKFYSIYELREWEKDWWWEMNSRNTREPENNFHQPKNSWIFLIERILESNQSKRWSWSLFLLPIIIIIILIPTSIIFIIGISFFIIIFGILFQSKIDDWW